MTDWCLKYVLDHFQNFTNFSLVYNPPIPQTHGTPSITSGVILLTNKQVRQQACKTHSPPYGLKQRRRFRFPMPSERRRSWETLPTRRMAAGPTYAAAPVTPHEPTFTKRGEILF